MNSVALSRSSTVTSFCHRIRRVACGIQALILQLRDPVEDVGLSVVLFLDLLFRDAGVKILSVMLNSTTPLPRHQHDYHLPRLFLHFGLRASPVR